MMCSSVNLKIELECKFVFFVLCKVICEEEVRESVKVIDI